MTERLMVIKTAWCDSYTGEVPIGGFKFISKGGAGYERYNMLRFPDGFEVYCIGAQDRFAPRPPPGIGADGWTIAHVASDPVAGHMKLIGWYEDATLLADYRARSNATNPTDSEYTEYCIRAARAFELLPVDRPTIRHNQKFGSGGFFWLRGGKSRTDWTVIADQIEQAIAILRPIARAGALLNVPASPLILGDTSAPLDDPSGLIADDGGDVYGFSRQAESDDHRALKNWALVNGALLTGESSLETSDTEWPLPSGDRVDVFHATKNRAWLIEVKSRRSGRLDLERGVYQCIKYLAVHRASMRASAQSQKATALLLLEQPDASIAEFAARLNVEVRIADIGAR